MAINLRSRHLRILTGCALIFTLLSAAPVSAQEPATSGFKCVESDPYYFHDIDLDEDNNAVTGLSVAEGTFDQEPPGASGPTGGPTAPLMWIGPAARPVPFSWEGEFSGELCGDLVMTMYGLVPPYPSDRPLVSQVAVFGDTCTQDGCGFQTSKSVELRGDAEVATVEFVMPVRYAVQRRIEFILRTDVAWPATPWPLGSAPAVWLWDVDLYPSGFTASTLQPCEVDDPHPDCQFEDLRAKVSAFAGQGLVSPEGETALLGVLDIMPLPGHRASEEGVAVVEEFRVLASDPVNVPSEAARVELLGDADRLITALQAHMSG